MSDEFYAILKLVSGEEILSLIMLDETHDEPILILQNPITMKVVQTTQGISLKVKPWLELPDDDFFILKMDKVMTMTETHDERLIEIYNNYILDGTYFNSSDSNGRVKISSKMGYVSSVEDARKKLEDVFKNL